ncbi:hypothetical protein BJ138DRAFT_1106010 [Hygrophoropsis aurantiaca]|uniref:Uncharacterized protein n=1 Tax=Hygrophoropsis aurantiaca TaxID=72124 RepID=A0ACB7ZWU4_9AGAM|nr:hypothetical protein BJ138DRAFT_1106010 [Hygrophoropsis aurantiaca]
MLPTSSDNIHHTSNSVYTIWANKNQNYVRGLILGSGCNEPELIDVPINSPEKLRIDCWLPPKLGSEETTAVQSSTFIDFPGCAHHILPAPYTVFYLAQSQELPKNLCATMYAHPKPSTAFRGDIVVLKKKGDGWYDMNGDDLNLACSVVGSGCFTLNGNSGPQ